MPVDLVTISWNAHSPYSFTRWIEQNFLESGDFMRLASLLTKTWRYITRSLDDSITNTWSSTSNWNWIITFSHSGLLDVLSTCCWTWSPIWPGTPTSITYKATKWSRLDLHSWHSIYLKCVFLNSLQWIRTWLITLKWTSWVRSSKLTFCYFLNSCFFSSIFVWRFLKLDITFLRYGNFIDDVLTD